MPGYGDYNNDAPQGRYARTRHDPRTGKEVRVYSPQELRQQQLEAQQSVYENLHPIFWAVGKVLADDGLKLNNDIDAALKRVNEIKAREYGDAKKAVVRLNELKAALLEIGTISGQDIQSQSPKPTQELLPRDKYEKIRAIVDTFPSKVRDIRKAADLFRQGMYAIKDSHSGRFPEPDSSLYNTFNGQNQTLYTVVNNTNSLVSGPNTSHRHR